MTNNVLIRQMIHADASSVASLSLELGYETTGNDAARRIDAILHHPDHGLFVAVCGRRIVGWVHVCAVARLQTDGYAEIGGIVVAGENRGQGTGRQLLRKCEEWASAKGCTRLRLRSGTHRNDAHQFYQGAGYEQSRASYAFERQLQPDHADPVQTLAPARTPKF